MSGFGGKEMRHTSLLWPIKPYKAIFRQQTKQQSCIQFAVWTEMNLLCSFFVPGLQRRLRPIAGELALGHPGKSAGLPEP